MWLRGPRCAREEDGIRGRAVERGFQPGFDQRRLETLATRGYIREHESVLIQGPPGIGKTHLAVALGVKAVECGFSVAFHRLDDLLHVLRRDADVP